MTREQLSSLEFLLEHSFNALALTSDAEVAHFEELNNLVLSERLNQLTFLGKRDLIAFMKKWGITIPSSEFDNWRMLKGEDQKLGEITALSESRGRLVATNGIMCYIERPNAFPYFGHVQFFVPDDKDYTVIFHGRKKKEPVERKKDKAEEYFNDFVV